MRFFKNMIVLSSSLVFAQTGVDLYSCLRAANFDLELSNECFDNAYNRASPKDFRQTRLPLSVLFSSRILRY
ncbi:Oidioi.mRNA.OKI2018_I69.chr1.g251.t1.cds [Oikopleura dioica]|uniref:Oidioi.mRNA.OKI2018_I69.chr1.g251.t1.cds n=1 Tax=Oikopleura dioica TaxID=34765 RepID=A0ABN7SKZ3_OIKDI|nr:Oidioi.mRNA.OKI2018_I69.chr1.g251.t1.cds [Oikopleura dioica]